MSDDEDFMTDRRGLKRAHESPQKINSLFEGQALDVGDECSIESDDYPEDWDEHLRRTTEKSLKNSTSLKCTTSTHISTTEKGVKLGKTFKPDGWHTSQSTQLYD